MALTEQKTSLPAIEAHELYRFYHIGDDETFALRGVSLRVLPGEVVAVVGPSGSGKSTLLGCLAGIDEPDGGYVSVFGERLTRRSEAQRALMRARAIGVLLQSDNLLNHLTLEQNVRLAQRLGGPGTRSDARALLRSVGIEALAASLPIAVSGGESVRAGLAVALANDPDILLADEPTGEVDAENERAIVGLLNERAAAGHSVIVVTHSARVAAAADRQVHMLDGRIVDG